MTTKNTSPLSSMLLKKNNFYIISIFIFQILIAFFLYFIFAPDYYSFNTRLLTYDSLLYRERAIEFCSFHPNIIDFISHYGINYSTISILGSISCITGSYNDIIIICINIFIMSLGYIAFLKVINNNNLKMMLSDTFLLLSFLYVPFSFIMLNKEIIGFSFICIILYLYSEQKYLLLILVGILFGLFRVQYIAIIILLFFIRKFNILIILLTINILIILFFPPLLYQWGLNVGGNDVVHSLNLMMKLEDLSYIPVLGILALIFRIFISLFVGLKAPFDLLYFNFTLGGMIYLISIMLLSLISISSIYYYVTTKRNLMNLKHYKLFKANKEILFSFLIINSIVPYLQPRYYLPIVFLLLINKIIYNRTRL